MKNLKVLFTVLCVACATAVWGETTYKLQAVSSVSAGDKCVFVQDNHAAIGSVSSSALQTTVNYQTTGLSGTENYVWIIETATNGFYIKNASLSSNPYLNNSSKTNISMGSKSSIWTITFTNEVALIQNSSNSDRFLGYTTASSYVYKAYVTTNMTSYPHAITVYKLIEESGSTETTNYTVHWIVGGTEQQTTSVKSGEKVSTLPTAPANNAIGDCADTFMGWSAHNLGSKTGQDAPTDLFTTAEGSPVITQDTTFYAVFATKKQQ